MRETTYSRWLISDMYYPSESLEGPIKSHEAICVLNTTDHDAALTVTLYFEDREPIALEPLVCPARRNVHFRMDEAKTADGAGVPMDTPYAAVVESTQEVAVQYSRADARQQALAVMTTIAQPIG